MRHLRMAFGLALTACLLFAVAAPALAHEFAASKYKFTISPETPVKTVGRTTEGTVQEFAFGRRVFRCQKAISKGTLTAPSSTNFTTHIVYGKCGWYPFPTKNEFIPATIKGGLTITFHVNGFAELEGNESGEEFEYGTKAELRETATTFRIAAGKYCTIIVPAQVVPARAITHPEEEFSLVKYSNTAVPVEETPTKLKLYPGGFQHKVIFAFALKPIKYRYAEGTQCGENEPKIEGASGKYVGEVTQEVTGGNLEFH